MMRQLSNENPPIDVPYDTSLISRARHKHVVFVRNGHARNRIEVAIQASLELEATILRFAELPHAYCRGGASGHHNSRVRRAAAKYGALLQVLERHERFLVIRVAYFDAFIAESPGDVALIVRWHQELVLLGNNQAFLGWNNLPDLF